jgi:hypothetical protein
MIPTSYNNQTGNYEFKVTRVLPNEFLNLINDIVKFTIIILVFNVMLYSRDSSLTSLNVILEQIIYVTLGLAFYWIVFDKLFKMI